MMFPVAMLRFATFLFTSAYDFWRARPPTHEEAAEDLKLLETLDPVLAALDATSNHTNPDAVRAYYEHTTYRDFRILNWLGGDGCMHTPLARDGPLRASFSEPVLLVLSLLRPATSVLELGCGKGTNSIFLKTLLPSLRIIGVDLTPAHVQHARLRASDTGCGDATFVVADAGNPTDLRNIAAASSNRAFDTVFAIESMCHLSHDGVVRLLRWARSHLADGGEMIVIDGFRLKKEDSPTRDVARACAELAERGFRLSRLRTMAEWRRYAEEAGLRVTMQKILTREALPFWSRWWRLARVLLRLPWLIRAYAWSGKERRRETLANFAAVLGTAPSMALGATEYGMLVFSKPVALS